MAFVYQFIKTEFSNTRLYLKKDFQVHKKINYHLKFNLTKMPTFAAEILLKYYEHHKRTYFAVY
jgi:hypothetical protein